MYINMTDVCIFNLQAVSGEDDGVVYQVSPCYKKCLFNWTAQLRSNLELRLSSVFWRTGPGGWFLYKTLFQTKARCKLAHLGRCKKCFSNQKTQLRSGCARTYVEFLNLGAKYVPQGCHIFLATRYQNVHKI
jgi:hypothetical protein